MKYRYKRSYKTPGKILKTYQKRDFREAVYFQLYLETEGYNIISAGELHINMRLQSLFNWNPRIFPSMVTEDAEP